MENCFVIEVSHACLLINYGTVRYTPFYILVSTS